ncbi:MAG: cytochrome ubiquinol oxidase subunit I [Deltaproteobacteria bacterium]|nr:cytochrome ubiquinol oxidase subunit I [Deltaproteobacteria bacterium]
MTTLRIKKILFPLLFTAFLMPLLCSTAFASEGGVFTPRLWVWLFAQLHLYFAAFILSVPVFVLILELTGVIRKDKRFDRVAREFLAISVVTHIVTVILGVIFAAVVFSLYSNLSGYMYKAFSPTVKLYAAIIIIDIALLYLYYLLWSRLGSGRGKLLHLGIGLLLNLSGIAIMFIANAWTTFMMAPTGVDASGVVVDLWQAINNPLWHPMNLHRFVANIAFGGAIVAAYAAYRFLSAAREEERARYDWMGYIAAVVSILALLPLPFAGYWLTSEIYSYSQQMGITLMGGVFGWMFIAQAAVIGTLFLGANYYLWCGFERAKGGAVYRPYVKYIAIVLALCFLVWFTPHTPHLSSLELKEIGGRFHPLLAPLGLMPAKNIAVNIMILATFVSFLLFRRAVRSSSVSWAAIGKTIQAGILSAAVLNIIFLGVYYGYFADSVYKITSSIPQVLTTLFALISCSVIEFFIYRGGESVEHKWGGASERSQYALIVLAVSFTWLMGLMGFIRSAIRQHWHVYTVVRDVSADAFTPTISYAAKVVSIITLIFLAIIIVIFRISHLRRAGEDR